MHLILGAYLFIVRVNVQPVIRTSVERRGFAAFLHRLCGGPQLNRRLQDERNFTFCLAACELNCRHKIVNYVL